MRVRLLFITIFIMSLKTVLQNIQKHYFGPYHKVQRFILARGRLGQSSITEPLATSTSGHFVLWPLRPLATSSSGHFNLWQLRALATSTSGLFVLWPL